MALIKSTTTKSTAVGEYWNAPDIRFNKKRKEVVALLDLYVNKAAYDAKAPPLLAQAAKVVIIESKFAEYFGTDNPDAAMLQKQVYLFAKNEGVISDYGEPVIVEAGVVGSPAIPATDTTPFVPSVQGKPPRYNGLRSTFVDAQDA